MRILLLGGTGTLSFDVLKASLREKHIVSILNRGNSNQGVSHEVNIYKANLSVPDSVVNVLGKDDFDIIVDFYSRKKEDIESLFPILSVKCKQYIFISSACVYKRDEVLTTPITERTDKPNPGWSYNIEKYEAEKALLRLSEQNSKTFYTIVRPYITYNNQRIPYGLAPAHKFHRTIIERIKSGKPMFLWDGGEAICTLTYSVDFANALVGLFLNPKAENEDFHITGDYSCSWRDMISILYDSLGIFPNVVDLPSRRIIEELPEYTGELMGDRKFNTVFDNGKIKNAVPGVSLNTKLEDGIRLVLEHYEQSTDYLYDYKYDARIDRMLSHLGIKDLRYVKYPNSSPSDKRRYLIYRYLPLKIAKHFEKFCR